MTQLRIDFDFGAQATAVSGQLLGSSLRAEFSVPFPPNGSNGVQGPVGPVGPIGPTGPQGVPGTGLEVLTTQGDLLYQGASTEERLAIGTSGQVLKVSGVGIPAWGNELGAVTSVNGQTGVVVLDAEDVGAEVGLEYISQSIDVAGNINTLANKHYTFTKNTNANISIRLPTTANDGDRIVIRRSGNNTQGVLTVDRLGGMPFVQTIGVLTAPNTVFFAVWLGLWRQDFVPPGGFQGAPASVSSFGAAGQMAFQDPHLYICVDSNTWRRMTLTTF